mmetsp:Transcript_2813/g.5211  ORF Transcript_2813/g.5211 Transcript_2813/m.5211 type:complete len:329 (-) Transcript_2813:2082-3068(-)
MELISPVQGILGGLLVGSSVYWNAQLLNRITGISGHFRKSMGPHWDVESQAFLGAMVATGLAYRVMVDGTGIAIGMETGISSGVGTSGLLLREAVGGVLVGLGTSLSNGCTSGHGVCGLGRLSTRSLVAVLTFMGSAMVTANVFHSSDIFRGVFPITTVEYPGQTFYQLWAPLSLVAIALPLVLDWATRKEFPFKITKEAYTIALQAITGSSFALGLLVSGMADPAIVVGFLVGPWTRSWNPTLMGVMGGAVAVSLVAFRKNRAPGNQVIDLKLIGGAAMFGIGWGLTGLCPGPAFVSLGRTLFKNSAINVFVAACSLGTALFKMFSK